MKTRFQSLENGSALALAALPVLAFDSWKSALVSAVENGSHLSMLTLLPEGRLCAVVADSNDRKLWIAATLVEKTYPSLTPDLPQAHLFEREIFEQHGIEPLGHPNLKPVRTFHEKSSKFRMEGEEVHEVAVGPVHAGVIEPGHFRFQCHGETVYHLEISLGYQHRGIEKKCIGGPNLRTPFYMETLAGDSSIGHATAYTRLVEALTGTLPPPRAETIRTIAAELERLANHVGDLGALSGDVGFLPTLSYCGRLRGDLLNLTALLCGNRFGRGLVRPGGVAFDPSPETFQTLETRLRAVESDVLSAVKLLFNAPSVLARFESTGTIDAETARKIGLVGPPARASGLERDVRHAHPYETYRELSPEFALEKTGDVLARARIRWLELRESFQLIYRLLEKMPDGETRHPLLQPLEADSLAVSLAEGWRGEIAHLACTDSAGRFGAYKVVDPSFHNWFGLALALRNEEISDFPICNKSFNLSYCGHDL